MAADIIILCLGSNDTPNPQNDDFTKGFREDYLDLVAHLRQSSVGTQLFLAKIPPIPKFPQLAPAVTNINSLIEAVSKECNASIIDLFHPIEGNTAMFSDGLHPNVEGARLIAETVYNAIKELL